jgi:hypothetical protein
VAEQCYIYSCHFPFTKISIRVGLYQISRLHNVCCSSSIWYSVFYTFQGGLNFQCEHQKETYWKFKCFITNSTRCCEKWANKSGCGFVASSRLNPAEAVRKNIYFHLLDTPHRKLLNIMPQLVYKHTSLTHFLRIQRYEIIDSYKK